MTVRNRHPPMMYANSHTAGVEMSLREAFTKAGNAAKAQPQLLVCILPTTGVFSSVPHLTCRLLCMVKLSVSPTLSLGSLLSAIKFPPYPIPLTVR